MGAPGSVSRNHLQEPHLVVEQAVALEVALDVLEGDGELLVLLEVYPVVVGVLAGVRRRQPLEQ